MALAGACVACGSQAQAAVGEQSTDFAAQVPLGLSGQGPWYRLELPLALQLSARRASLDDIRIFNSAGMALSFALFRERDHATAQLQENAVRWFPLYDAPNAPVGATPAFRAQLSQTGSLVSVEPGMSADDANEKLRGWLIDTSAIDGPLAHLNIDWNSDHDGFQRFSIEASDDLQHWRPCGEGQLARVLFAGKRVERHEVELPGRQARYLRLLWLSPHTAPLLNNVHVFSRQHSQLPPTVQWTGPIVGHRVGADEYTWQLPAQLEVERLKLDIAQGDNLAPLTIYGRNTATEPWRALGDGLVYRKVEEGQELIADELPLAGVPLREVKIRIVAGGRGLDAEAPSMRVAVQPTQIVFLAVGKPPFSLAVGNAQASPDSLPLETLLAASPRPLGELGVARLAGTPMIAMVTRAPVPEEVDWRRVAMIAVAVMGLAVLVAMGRGVLKRRET